MVNNDKTRPASPEMLVSDQTISPAEKEKQLNQWKLDLELELNASDRGGTRTRPIDGSAGGRIQVACKPLAQVLAELSVKRIDALKIDVEGAEDRILLPFFKDEPVSLWPRFIIIEDSRKDWRADLFAELQARDYKTVSRTRQNVMLALTPQIS